jgi:hypothetical protein
LNRIGISFFLVTKSRTGSTARCWEGAAVELTSGDGERRRDDVWAVEKLLLRHFWPAAAREVVRFAGARGGVLRSGVDGGLEREGDGAWDLVWEVSGGGVSSMARLGSFL